jgi:hypothetical protein
MLENAGPAVAVGTEGARDAGTAGCVTGGRSEVIQARLSLEIDGARQSTVDVEVQGPEHEARAACEALVTQERRPETAVGGSVAVRIVRPCSNEALAVAEIDALARLIERDELDAVSLAIRTESACPPAEAGRMRAVVLRQAGYPSMAQCESMRALLLAARAEAERRAAATASDWLDGALERATRRMTERCGGDEADAGTADAAPPSAAAVSPECEQEQRLVALLGERRAALRDAGTMQDGGAEGEEADPAAASPVGIICRPGEPRARQGT